MYQGGDSVGDIHEVLLLNTKMSMEDAEYVIENFAEIVKGVAI